MPSAQGKAEAVCKDFGAGGATASLRSEAEEAIAGDPVKGFAISISEAAPAMAVDEVDYTNLH